MNKFYIDRQFGHAIFIDVEKGLVVNCYNESEKYCNKMNELYIGKSISFLKTDYEKRMKGTYHNVRPLNICTILNKIDTIKTWVDNTSRLIYNAKDNVVKVKELNEQRDKYIAEQSILEKELVIEKNRLLIEHNYKF